MRGPPLFFRLATPSRQSQPSAGAAETEPGH